MNRVCMVRWGAVILAVGLGVATFADDAQAVGRRRACRDACRAPCAAGCGQMSWCCGYAYWGNGCCGQYTVDAAGPDQGDRHGPSRAGPQTQPSPSPSNAAPRPEPSPSPSDAPAPGRH